MRTRNYNKKVKVKKQFRLYDVYRCAVTDDASVIMGISSYEVNKEVNMITINYALDRGVDKVVYIVPNEEDLKMAVKAINKRLGNCERPGRKV